MRRVEMRRPGSLGMAALIALLGACASASNAHQASSDAGVDASAYTTDASANQDNDGACLPGQPGCASAPDDAGTSPMSDAGTSADSSGSTAADGGANDSGPALGVTGSSWDVAKGAPGPH